LNIDIPKNTQLKVERIIGAYKARTHNMLSQLDTKIEFEVPINVMIR